MILLAIACDACLEKRWTRERKAHLFRRRLAERGWKHVESGGKDYCPKCVKSRKKARSYGR
jgi:hypothetical protein